MRGMLSCPDFVQAPPAGRYPSIIKVANPGFSQKNESHIEITTEITDGPFKGAQAYDYIGTDGTTKYGVGGKRKLRQLGITLDTDAEVPDAVIAQQLLGLNLMIEYGNEQQQNKDAGGTLTPRFELDAKGNKVAVMRLTVIGYIRAQGAAQQFPQGQQMAAPLPVPGAPQGFPAGPFPGAPGPGLPPGVVPQAYGVPQGAPPGLPQAWGGAPQGFAPQNGVAPAPAQLVPAPPGWGAPVPGAVPGR